jgi:hypothetical protein
MADDKFRLPGSSYPELVKIIKAYGHAKPDSGVEDVAKLAVMNRTTISRSTVFLTSVGVIRGGHKKSITNEGKALAQALEHDIPDEVTRNWRPLVENHEYFQKLVAAVRIRNGMDFGTLAAHAAYTAGQANTPEAKTGAAAAIDILRAAGILVERDGKLFVSHADQQPISQPTIASPVQAPSPEPATSPAQRVLDHPVSAVPGLSINIRVNITCGPDDVAELGPKLRQLISDVAALNEATQPEKPGSGME